MSVSARDMTLSRVERLESTAGEMIAVLQMDEDAFRLFYERTARPLWAYLSRVTGDAHMADDLLQEAYYRLLRAGARFESDAHRRNYLYRIATNLARDEGRRRQVRRLYEAAGHDRADPPTTSEGTHGATERADLRRAFARLSAREREALWLAYAEGASHREIADALGLKAGGIRVLLFRARRKLARLLHVASPEKRGGSDRAQD